MKIIFMGTPEFAVPSLDILVQNGYDVVGVITATDKLGGRGRKQLIQSDVKKYALEKGIKVMQPKNLKSEVFQSELKALKADLQIVVAFRMLPVPVWDMPPLGTVNLHGSLLPKYRGAAPINWSIINGDTETGVTSFKLKHEIDTGDMIFQSKLDIGPNENVSDIHDKMKVLGAAVVLKTVQAIESGEVVYQAQDNSIVSHAPKIHRSTCKINFDQDAQSIHNFIRGLSPFPGSWSRLNDLQLKILKAKILETHSTEKAGTLQTDNKTYIYIHTKTKLIEIEALQLEGKRRMDTKVFLQGVDMTDFEAHQEEKVLIV